MNIVFTDKFLGNAFLTYGPEVIKFSNMNQETRYDPMIAVSKRLKKCHSKTCFLLTLTKF